VVIVQERGAPSLKKEDAGWLALEYAFDLLDEPMRSILLDNLKTNCTGSLLETNGQMDRNKVEEAMKALFNCGANLLMKRFDYFNQLRSNAAAAGTGVT
jgi:hypothetical protein